MQPNSTELDSSPVTSSVSSATQEFLKTVDPGNDRKKYTAAPLTLNSEASGGSTNERPLADIISEKFEPFDTVKYMITPFEVQNSRDAVFEEEFTTMLLEMVLETHAWATTRFKVKTQLECQKLEEQLSRIMEKEREQGMSSSTLLSPASVLSLSSSVSKLRDGIVEKVREGLANFVLKMKMALAALTGVEA